MKSLVVSAISVALSFVGFADVISVPLDGDIAAAVESAQPGDVVQLAAGEYPLTAEVRIEAGITVRGAGRFLTTVKSDGVPHRLFTLGDPGAVLSDLTVQGAVTVADTAVRVNKGTVQDAIVKNCTGGNGAGIYLEDGTVRRCVLTGNSGNWGGGIYPHGTCRVESVLAYGNTAAYGGGIYVENTSHATIVNCTFAGNMARTSGADVYNYTGNNVTFVNTYRGYVAGSPGVLVQSPDSTTSAGFVATDIGVCRLSPESALYGAGSKEDLPAADADGSPMPETPSIGAFQPSANPWIVPESTSVARGASADVTVNYPDAAAGGAGTLVVIKPDGTRLSVSAADGAKVSFAVDQGGAYSLMLLVEKDGTNVVRDLCNAIAAGIFEVYVDPNATNPVEPYVTPETAAATIADALPFVSDGGTLWIAEGELTLSAEIRISKPITVRGAGRLLTTVKSDGRAHRLFYLDDDGAVLSDLTVSHAVTSGGSAVQVNRGTFQDAIVKNCEGTDCYGGGVWLENGTVRRCVLTGNKAKNGGGGLYTHGVCRVESVLSYGNTATWGGGLYVESMSEATFVNCTFAANTTSSSGPDVYNYSGLTKSYNTYWGRLVTTPKVYVASCDSSTAPGFVSTDSGVFLLGSGSSLLGAGTTEVEGGRAAADVNGIPLTSRPSIGACQPLSDSPWIVPSSAEVPSGNSLDVTVRYPDEASGGEGVLVVVRPDGQEDVIDVGDGETVSVEAAVTGPHSLVLRVVKDGEIVTRDIYHAFLVGIGNVFVNPNATGSVEPYDTPETAARTIEEVLPFVMAGGKIWIAEGECPVSATLTIGKAVTICGAGPDKTVLAAKADVRLVSLNHAEAKIMNLALLGTAVSSASGGKGVYFQAGGSIENCTFEDFASAANGGAVACAAGACGRIERCVFRYNTGNWGGAVYVPANGRVDIFNSLFYGNTAKYGAAVMTQGVGSLVNCTIVDNPMTNVSQGEFERENNDFGVTNCIFGSVCWYSGSKLNQSCNLGDGTTLVDPGFRDRANHDYRPSAGAAAVVDQGDDSAVELGETDLAGAARISGEHVDLGCYELAADEFSVDFEIVGSATEVGDSITLVPIVRGAADAENSWRIVNVCGGPDITGKTEGSGETAAFAVTFAEPGVYSILCSATAGGKAASRKKDEVFIIGAESEEIYVASSGTPIAPYDAPEKATTNLSAAVLISPANATIHVLEGTFLVDRRLTVEDGRKVVGAGRDKTVLTPGLKSDHGVFKMASADSAITDMTITGASDNQAYADGAGGGVLMSAGLLANVAMTNLVMSKVNGSAIYATGGRISRVEMRGCTGSTSDPGGVFLVSGKTAIDNALVCDCEGNWGSTVFVMGGEPAFTNCTFVYRGTCTTPIWFGHGGVKFVNCNFDCRIPQDGTVYPKLTDAFCNCNFAISSPETNFEENGNFNIATENIGFVDAVNGNYRLKEDSPLVAAGICAKGMSSQKDLDGKKRTTAGKVSVGCYQCCRPDGLAIVIQ